MNREKASLEPEKVVHLVGQGRQVGVDAPEDVELGKSMNGKI